MSSGIHAKPLKDDEVVHSYADLRVVLVRPPASVWQRKRIQALARRANWEMHYDFGIYDPLASTTCELDVHALLGYVGAWGIALLLLARRCRVLVAAWSDADPPRIGNAEVVETDVGRWTIDFLWVSPQFRGRGIAGTLIREASRFTGVKVTELAWNAPFSESARRLVRRLSPERLYLGK
jgi:ribosomal protein S18 acetylase RimI-like enzyme